MKKADLLKELQGIVELNLMIVEEHLSAHAIEVITKAMLSHAETRGMLPPFQQKGHYIDGKVYGDNVWKDDEEDWE